MDRSKNLHVRVSDDELTAFEAAATRAGLPLSQWVRNRLLEAARKEARRAEG